MTNPYKMRDVKITLTLAEAARAVGHKDWLSVNDCLDADQFEDVYHDGYRAADIESWQILGGYEAVAKIAPHLYAHAAEEVERSSIASQIGERRREHLAAIFEGIRTSSEYIYDDTMIVLPDSPQITGVILDVPGSSIEIFIHGPEHLLNNVISGVGMFAAPFDPTEEASPEEIKEVFLNNIYSYYDVYGERVPKFDLDHIYGRVKDKDLEECLNFLISLETSENWAENIVDAVENEKYPNFLDAIRDYSTIETGISKDEASIAVLNLLKKRYEKNSERYLHWLSEFEMSK
jgi:hypothetical protein